MGGWKIRGNRYVSRLVQPAKKAFVDGVDATKNVRKGQRPRIGKTVVEPELEKVFTQKVINVPKPQEFQPYYISLGNPNPTLSKAQNQAKLEQIERSINELGQHVKRQSDIYGIETPATHKAAMYRAVATNPNATMAPPEGTYRLPYKSGGQEWEGAPLSEWFDLASQGMLPYGPNALWRKWEQPLKDATNSWDVIGQLRGVGAPAPEMSLQQLGEALRQMAPYLKKQGGILSAKSGIHIKKKNRGKFTSWCGGKVTSECIARGKRSSNPAIRKRATFAANSRRWHHKNGGIIMPNWAFKMLNNARQR